MKGIKLSHGVAFVECDGVTVRIGADGKCELSRILLPSLEWDLRTEPPESWEYITESDVDAYGEDVKAQIKSIVEGFRKVTGQ